MCGYGFYYWGVNKIWSFVDSDNVASLQMSYKIGYKQEGILRKELYKGGKLLDRVYLGMLETDFNKVAYEELLSSTVMDFSEL